MSENSEKSSTKEGEKKISLPPWNSINQDNSDKKPVANGTVNTGSSNSALGMLGSYIFSKFFLDFNLICRSWIN
jgi:hypothetical protein